MACIYVCMCLVRMCACKHACTYLCVHVHIYIHMHATSTYILTQMALQDADGLVLFLAKLRELSGGKPVGFKLCVGLPEEFASIVHAMIRHDVSINVCVRLCMCVCMLPCVYVWAATRGCFRCA